MLYELEQGQTEQAVIKAAFSARQPLPDTIRDAPQLLPGLDLYWQAFLSLSRFRDANGRIDLGNTLRYAEWQEFSPEQTDDLVFFIGELDDAFQQWRQEHKK